MHLLLFDQIVLNSYVLNIFMYHLFNKIVLKPLFEIYVSTTIIYLCTANWSPAIMIFNVLIIFQNTWIFDNVNDNQSCLPTSWPWFSNNQVAINEIKRKKRFLNAYFMTKVKLLEWKLLPGPLLIVICNKQLLICKNNFAFLSAIFIWNHSNFKLGGQLDHS